MFKAKTLTLRILSIALIGALLVGGCSGTITLDGGLDTGGDEGGGETNFSQNQLLVVLLIILLVVAVAGILR